MADLDKEEFIDALFSVFGQDGSDRGFADLMWETFAGPDNWERRTATAAMQGLLAYHGDVVHPDIMADKAMAYSEALETRLRKHSQQRLDAQNVDRQGLAKERQRLKEIEKTKQEMKELFG